MDDSALMADSQTPVAVRFGRQHGYRRRTTLCHPSTDLQIVSEKVIYRTVAFSYPPGASTSPSRNLAACLCHHPTPALTASPQRIAHLRQRERKEGRQPAVRRNFAPFLPSVSMRSLQQSTWSQWHRSFLPASILSDLRANLTKLVPPQPLARKKGHDANTRAPVTSLKRNSVCCAAPRLLASAIAAFVCA
jgi:hypothetical protein